MASAQQLENAAELLRQARRVVVFTGAGISQESGIPTFRDDAGLWRDFDPARFASPAGLLETVRSEPEAFGRFLLAVLEPVADAAPNPGHAALAALEETHEVEIITQNIDGLHHEAGSDEIHQIHGSLLEVVGVTGHLVKRLSRMDLRRIVARLRRALRGRFRVPRIVRAVQPLLGLGGGLVHRPRVVLFGEGMAEPDWSLSREAVRRCQLLLAVGTSLEVWPAAGLVEEAREGGARVITINPERADGDVWLEGQAGVVLPAVVAASRR
jgi:NAD-dependent deacetylase